MKNLFDISDKVVVITGAYGVLGSAISEHFAREGAKVVLLGRNVEQGERLLEKILSEGGEAMFLKSDVLDIASLEQNREDILARYGRIDVLINAAGGNMPKASVAQEGTIFDLDLEAVKAVVDLNLYGTIYPTMVFAKAMVKNKSKQGSIINFCSESSLRPLTRVAGYGLAKSAVMSWTKWLCGELAMKYGDGFRVNAIVPGFIITNQNRALLTNPDGSLTPRAEKILGHTPYGRFLEAEEMLGTMQYLASDASRGVSGTMAVVDGGFDAFSI